MRISLLIVDDEYAIREKLKRLVDWDSNHIEVVGYAENGLEAVELINTFWPDAVLTDVRMPGMDGIELSKWIKENHPEIKVIFLSAYSDFDYAKKALKYDVVEYLLKPVDINLLLETINTVRGDIIRNRAEKFNIEKLKSLLEKNMPILREKYIRDVLEGKYQSDIEEIFRLYSIDLYGDFYAVAVAAIENSFDRTASCDKQIINYELLKLELADLISKPVKEPYKVYIFNENNESVGIVFAMSRKHEKPYTLKGITGILEKTREFFSERGYVLTIGISNMNSDIKTLNNSYNEALKALKTKVYKGIGTVIAYSGLDAVKPQTGFENDESEKIFEYMKNYDWVNVQLSIKRYFDRYASSYDLLEKHPNFIIYDLLSILKRILALNNDSSRSAVSQTEVDELLKHATLSDMYDGVVNLYKKYYNILVDLRNGNANKAIQYVKEYIDKNLMIDLNLTDVAASTYLSLSALSKMFFRETGELFSDYLTRCRIEKAKELLLNSNLMVYEISGIVGYQSEKHFISLFKKVIGLTPMEFKKRNIKIIHGQ